MNPWPLKDVVYIGAIIFNLGAVLGTVLYVLKAVERRLDNIFARLSEAEKDIAEVRGSLSGKKDK